MSLKIAWLSNPPWMNTGYGKQTALFTPRLKELGHEVAILAQCGLAGGQIEWHGLPAYPQLGGHAYGQDMVNPHSLHFGADITIALLDLWVYDPTAFDPKVRFVPWFPVDQEPLPLAIAEKARQSYTSIVYSKFALEQARTVGLDPYYVPHGVDTKVFKAKPKQEARAALEWPEDTFIFGLIADNKGVPLNRKAFSQQIEAFARFHAKHPDSKLYLHTNVNGEQDLIALCQHLGIGDAVMACDQFAYIFGHITDEMMCDIYNGIDCLLSVTMGEGFGVPILEAQACGTPVIVGDWTAMSELCFAGWKISKEDAFKFQTPLLGYWYLPKPEAIVAAMETAHEVITRSDTRLGWDLGNAIARVEHSYDVEVVTEHYWKPVLEAIEAKIKEQGSAPRTFAEALKAV